MPSLSAPKQSSRHCDMDAAGWPQGGVPPHPSTHSPLLSGALWKTLWTAADRLSQGIRTHIHTHSSRRMKCDRQHVFLLCSTHKAAVEKPNFPVSWGSKCGLGWLRMPNTSTSVLRENCRYLPKRWVIWPLNNWNGVAVPTFIIQIIC